MRKEQFISFIDAPALQKGESIPLLSQLVKQYPYCQTAQLLLAKALHNENSIGYSDQLKVAAAYASDRKVLYHLIMSKPPVEATGASKNDAPPVTITIPEDDTELLNNLVVSAEANVENQESETGETETPGEEENPINEVPGAKKEDPEQPVKLLVSEEKQDDKKVQPESFKKAPVNETTETVDRNLADEPSVDKPENVNIEELPLLDKNIIVEAIDASIELEVAENMPFRETENLVEENAETPEPHTYTGTTDNEEPWEEFDPDKTYSFSEWLKLSKKAKQAVSEKTEEKEKDQTETREKEKRTAKRKSIDELIDKFITEEPKITRPSIKQEFFSPVNMARQSVQDDNEFVTETLANIYLRQGSFAKALKAYETLSLKFPEKKLYFAARIKEIKKIIKEQK